MKTKMQMDSNKVRLITTDSGGVKKIKDEQLPRGTLSCFNGKLVNYIEKVDKDVDSQWNVVTIRMNKNAILMITMYRLPNNSRQGMYTVKTQIDYKKAKVKTVKQHRDKMIVELSQFIDE